MVPNFPGGNGNPYPKKKLYQRIHNRLSTQAPFANVRHDPSKTRPRRICAEVDPALFVASTYPASQARLEFEFEFDLRPNWNHYRIQWIEPIRNLSCGWHQDMTHMELGKCHFQVDYPDGSTERDSASFLDAHPLTVVERRLSALSEHLTTISLPDRDTDKHKSSAGSDR